MHRHALKPGSLNSTDPPCGTVAMIRFHFLPYSACPQWTVCSTLVFTCWRQAEMPQGYEMPNTYSFK